MSLTAEQVIRILERRYDFVSARVAFRRTCEAVGVAPAGPFEDEVLRRFAESLLSTKDQAEKAAALLKAGLPDLEPAVIAEPIAPVETLVLTEEPQSFEVAEPSADEAFPVEAYEPAAEIAPEHEGEEEPSEEEAGEGGESGEGDAQRSGRRRNKHRR